MFSLASYLTAFKSTFLLFEMFKIMLGRSIYLKLNCDFATEYLNFVFPYERQNEIFISLASDDTVQKSYPSNTGFNMKIIVTCSRCKRQTLKESYYLISRKIKYLLERAFHPFPSSYITKSPISKHLKKCERLLTNETS